jgi:hypothetical protein
MLALIHFLLAWHITVGPTFDLARTHVLRPQEMVSVAPSFTRSVRGMVITWRMSW